MESSFARRSGNLLAGIIVGLMVLVVPAGYFIVSYQYLTGSLDAQAAVTAMSITGVIQANPAMWNYEQVRLTELMERKLQYDERESRRLRDNKGELVAEHTTDLSWPVIVRQYPVYDAGTVVGTLEVSRSIDWLLLKTVTVAVLMLLVGLALFFLVRLIPRRAIQNAFSALSESEQRYRSLYSSMREGLALHRLIRDDQGRPEKFALVEFNPACQRLLGLDSEAAQSAGEMNLLASMLMSYFHEIVQAVEYDQPLNFELALPDRSRFFSVSVFSPAPDMFATLLEEITERKKSDQQIQQLAYYDSLTGLPNRSLLFDRLNQALARANRAGDRVAVLFLDLDRFKDINDTLGHAYGDLLLIEVSRRLQGTLRRSDTLARLGGDEFVIMFSYDNEELNVAHLAQNVLDTLSAPYRISGRELFSSVSIGVATYPEDGQDVDSLLRSADLAMYAAKQEGRNSYHFYSEEMNRQAHERLDLEHDLRHALQRDELFLEFQPVVNAREVRVVGVEALVRWQHPERGRTMPDVFIPVAEETSLVVPLGEWVLRAACRQLNAWLAAGLPEVRLAINVSGRQIAQDDFPDLVAAVLAESGVPAHLLELEVTETSLMEHVAATTRTLRQLKGLGVAIAIDDFGTGYSSLGYLKNFALDRIKIDRTFVRDIYRHEDDQAIVEAIIAMAGRLKLAVVAEGVESVDQLNFLLGHGCEELQGYYYSRPLPAEQLAQLLRGPVVPAA